MGNGHQSGSRARRLMVTGGCGFIGSTLVRHLLAGGAEVLNLDKLNYAGSAPATYASESRNYEFVRADICDHSRVSECLASFTPDAVIHLAAETHVDRSIASPAEFVQTNVVGTWTLLRAALEYRDTLKATPRDNFRFVHVSTDEVYGELADKDSPFTEQSPYRPNSPYSASKAAADHFVRAWGRTYGLPVIVSNCCNNYGPFQFPEKLIPTIVIAAMEGKPLPVYGAGQNIREWLYVEDHVTALMTILDKGVPGEAYLVGSGEEMRNLDVVKELCRILDEIRSGSGNRPHEQLVTFVADRPGHDFRHALDSSKIRHELGWQPRESFASGLRKTVQWYMDNAAWWRERIAGDVNCSRSA